MAACPLRRHPHPWTLCVAFFVANAVLLVLWTLHLDDDRTLDFREKEMLLLRSKRRADHYCDSLDRLEFVAAGWTKAVYRLRRGAGGGRDVAVKQVNLDGHDMTTCLRSQAPWSECYRKSAAKIMKEIVLLRELEHPNVLKILGFCIPSVETDESSGGGVSLVTELGQSLDMIRLLQSSWEDRLRIVLGVARLVDHLSHSPLGALVMNDFRRQQFVLVDGELKLSDVDDMELEEPECAGDDDCVSVHEAAERVLRSDCAAAAGRCRGYNEKQNVFNAGRHFVSFLLPHGAPRPLRPRVDAIVAAFDNATWDSTRLLNELEQVHRMFVSGEYLRWHRIYSDALTRGFRRVEQSDLPGMHDYRCQLTVSGSGCTLSVFDDVEAAMICQEDVDCRAFVVTSQRSWTGRRIAHFKNNVSAPVRSEGTTLFIKHN